MILIVPAMAEEPNNADPPAHDFYTFDHAGRNLLQPVYPGKGTEHGTGVDEYLCIGAVQPIDPDLLKPTILTVSLYTDTRLKIQAL